MRLLDEVKECVGFISKLVSIDNESGDAGTFNILGTGFLVSVPAKELPNVQYQYLVTAKHVVAGLGDRKLGVRFNDKSGKAVYAVVDEVSWYDHPDHSANQVDLSVAPLSGLEKLSYKTVPSSMLLTTKTLKEGKIGIGDEVFIIGLFTKLIGEEKNLPIVRMGNIAMVPGEKVPTKMFGNIDAYLIEARSIGGISGAPVFVRETTQLGNGKLYLAGLMHGHWDLPPDIEAKLPKEASADGVLKNQSINMGIAIVTPAQKILETINQPVLAEAREKHEEKLIDENKVAAETSK